MSVDVEPVGHGRMLRKEDPRFIRGRGNYVDDVQLPGMLHLAILRSPYAHATIKGIDTTAAQAHPKVKAVITGADLAEKGLAWMPTLSNDVQAVLATDKVRFQGQEVAFVVAEDRYSARDALELIDVDYEPLDPVIDVRHLPGFLDDRPPAAAPGVSEVPKNALDAPGEFNLHALETNAIRAALSNAGGNRTHAAELLGISRRTLQRKLKDLGL